MRTILHCDMNNFYASVECLYRPELREKPVAVCGEAELRHGIVLAKNYPARACGIRTGEATWQARQKCPGLIVLPPTIPAIALSRLARDIYADYTDQIEPFGPDEAWLDVTGSGSLFGSGRTIADEIRRRIRQELGVTASVGVSWNKIFAKLGSDLNKPDATTVISRENFRDRVWPLPVGDLLYVAGRPSGSWDSSASAPSGSWRAPRRRLCTSGSASGGMCSTPFPTAWTPPRWRGWAPRP
jgi:DNA polymerase-4